MTRRLALAIGRALPRIFPPHMRGWGEGMACEIAAIGCDRRALSFALACLKVALVEALRFELSPPLSPAGGQEMKLSPVTLGIACAAASCALGLAYLHAAGAPPRYIAVNASSFAIGLGALGAVTIMRPRLAGLAGIVAFACAAALLATGLFGVAVDGAARWVRIGALAAQPSLVLVPPLLVLFAARRNLLTAAAVMLAAAAMAVQPDRAMAGTLSAAVAAVALSSRGSWTLAPLLAAGAAFAATLLRPDRLPAAPFVDQIFYSSFEVHPAAGVAVAGGALLLLVPAVVGATGDAERRGIYLALGATWTGVSVAAALGNYPTPVVGFGGSAIVGYLLSLAALPRAARATAVSSERAASRTPTEPEDRQIRAALA